MMPDRWTSNQTAGWWRGGILSNISPLAATAVRWRQPDHLPPASVRRRAVSGGGGVALGRGNKLLPCGGRP